MTGFRQDSGVALALALLPLALSFDGYRDLKNEGRMSMAGRDSISVTPRSAVDSYSSKQDSRNSLTLRDSLGGLPLTPHSSNSTFDLSGTPLSASNAFSMYSQGGLMEAVVTMRSTYSSNLGYGTPDTPPMEHEKGVLQLL
uniref:Uncharacterized protein n=1 Tax=Branchiostoma floridae TaxID=7739 RepID=C3Z7Z2_BRAFL|eukprot:XP_002595294.1 hypothetical protein BRAFLDRAFT_96827 [Branchiostoma floridae]